MGSHLLKSAKSGPENPFLLGFPETKTLRMEVDQDPEVPSSSSCAKNEKKRFEVKKWNAVALWAWDIEEDTAVDTVLATMASVRPRLSPRLLLILTFTATEDTDWDTDTVLEDTTVDTVLATTASVRPRPSPRLLLI